MCSILLQMNMVSVFITIILLAAISPPLAQAFPPKQIPRNYLDFRLETMLIIPSQNDQKRLLEQDLLVDMASHLPLQKMPEKSPEVSPKEHAEGHPDVSLKSDTKVSFPRCVIAAEQEKITHMYRNLAGILNPIFIAGFMALLMYHIGVLKVIKSVALAHVFMLGLILCDLTVLYFRGC
jgi:hypothetical protein